MRAHFGVVAAAGFVVVFDACSQPHGSEDLFDLPAPPGHDGGGRSDAGRARQPEDASPGEPSGPADASAELDADLDADASASVDAGPCADRPNGHRWGVADDQRCCEGQPASLHTTDHCGACGIVCAAGRTCEEQSAGRWLCRGCVSNDECAAAVGSGATCYESYCDCQGTCLGDASCNVVSGHNYCAY